MVPCHWDTMDSLTSRADVCKVGVSLQLSRNGSSCRDGMGAQLFVLLPDTLSPPFMVAWAFCQPRQWCLCQTSGVPSNTLQAAEAGLEGSQREVTHLSY